MNLVYIALFGALGSLARYGIGLLGASYGLLFPWGTLLINILGSFILGFVATLALQNQVSETTRLAIAVGFCGAFTTFSTFEFEVMNAILEGRVFTAIIYVTSSLILGLIAVFIGRVLAFLI
jgi:fluoride exporter